MNYWKSLRDKLEDKQILQPLTRRGRGSVRLVIVKFVLAIDLCNCYKSAISRRKWLEQWSSHKQQSELGKNFKIDEMFRMRLLKDIKYYKSVSFFHRNNITSHTNNNIQYILICLTVSSRERQNDTRTQSFTVSESEWECEDWKFDRIDDSAMRRQAPQREKVEINIAFKCLKIVFIREVKIWKGCSTGVKCEKKHYYCKNNGSI